MCFVWGMKFLNLKAWYDLCYKLYKWLCMLGGDYMWGNCELGMISTWIVHEWLDTYVCACGHKPGMSNNGSWWLVNLWYGFCMRRNTLLMIGNNELVMTQHMRNEDLVMDLCLKSYVQRMCKFLAVYVGWFVSVLNSLESLGETFRVVLQWSGRNSMALVSGCPWWCPICITR